MDKLDESIKSSKASYQPNQQFVDNTMQHIEAPKKRFSVWNKVWTPVALGTVLVIAIVFIALPGHRAKTDTVASANNSSATLTQTDNSVAADANALPAGDTDADLAADLTSVNTSINQENSDQNNANSGLNDSSQEITIPTD